jgi:hypothetical protein
MVIIFGITTGLASHVSPGATPGSWTYWIFQSPASATRGRPDTGEELTRSGGADVSAAGAIRTDSSIPVAITTFILKPFFDITQLFLVGLFTYSLPKIKTELYLVNE